MHFSSTLLAAVAALPAVMAHGDNAHGHMPQIFGRSTVAELKARNVFGKRSADVFGSGASAGFPKVDGSEARAKRATDTCGAGVGSCDAGYCCSPAGYCGTTSDYCYSPGCQYQYGPGCPENSTPAGTNTSSIARTKVGSVEYGGVGIYACTVPGTVALTYDDGPYIYTDHILDLFASYGGKATFFITGNNLNKGEIDTTSAWSTVIKRMDTDGHQIASHTWTHLDLSAISAADRNAQMIKNEMALRNIIGKIPTYMRPPYSSCTAESGCESDLANLGYHITYFDIDTDDYDQDDPSKIQNSKNWFYGNITANGATASNSEHLVIEHDIHNQTANNLTEYMLQQLQTLGYKAVTVGDCLGDPSENWYRSASGSSATTSATTSAPTSTSTATISTDGTCGGTTGYTCQGSTFGNCCSQYGWCGSTTDHCGTGCNSAFGTCGSTTTTSSGKTSSSSTNKPVSSSTRPASSSTRAASSSTKPVSSSKPVSSTKTSASATPSSTLKVSTDATCGGTTGFTCQGSTFGNCCSVNGWCGSTSAYCGTGCQSGFGSCTGSGVSSSSVKPASSSVKQATSTKKSSAAPTSTLTVSTDGSCGSGKTCQGSTFGNCCSQYGWCGSTTDYCSTGCQSGFGTCS